MFNPDFPAQVLKTMTEPIVNAEKATEKKVNELVDIAHDKTHLPTS